MVCETVKTGDGYAIVCSRGRRKPPKCACGRPSTKLCDWPTANGKTCDKPLCAGCAVHVGRDRDHCPDHALEAA